MNKTERAEIIKYMADLVEVQNRQYELKVFNDSISTTFTDYDTTLMHKGIKKMAEAVGAELVMKTNYCEDFPYFYSFNWNGFLFKQLSEKPIDLGKDEVCE